MSDTFAQNVIKELNRFRTNPKSIQHQCELIRKGLSRLKSNDPFLKEIDSFVKELDSFKPLPQLKYNVTLSEAAKKELPNFRGRDNYQKYRKSIKGIVPDYYLVANPALVADDGADEPVNVLTKTLLNKLDKHKEGRSILCDSKFTEVGAAHEVFDQENMVILIFATKHVEEEQKPIRSSKKEFIMNIQYHETKYIKKPKNEALVRHIIKGDIFGGGNFEKTSYQKEIFSQGGNRPLLEQRKIPQPLKSNKSEIRMVGKRTSFNNERIPFSIGSAKNEKFETSTMKRRNEGTSFKRETKSQSRTNVSGPGIFGGTSSSKTTTTTTTRTVTTNGGGNTISGSSVRSRFLKNRKV